jgi:calcineurin-like phosphoesterase family protein
MSVYIEPISLKVTPEHNVFAISDTHFGHDRDFIYKKRGYNCVADHDNGVIKQWNSKVTNNDTVLHFGDIMFGKGGLERLLMYFQVLNFHKFYLMPGNHHAGIKQFIAAWGDRSDPYYVNSVGDETDKQVILLPNYAEFFINGQAVVGCHYPISSWNGMGHGSWCLSGHVHNSFIGTQLDNPNGKCLDVGIDTVKGVISFTEIKEIMDKKRINIVDHHGASIKNPF